MRKYYEKTHYSVTARIKLILELGGKCSNCGYSDIRALQLDHIKGGGTKERKKLSAYSVYLKYLKNIGKTKKILQILCANCNWIKIHENQETKGRPRLYK